MLGHQRDRNVESQVDSGAIRQPRRRGPRYPSDRGTGGFDLGYTSPEFRQDAPNNGIFPEGGTLAGMKDEGGTVSWFQDQDNWGTQFAGWPGASTTDKAARYTHCLANQPNNVVQLTQATPDGTRTIDMTGQIPSGPVRVVFEDDNYDPRKDEARYDSNVLTWHWDNIQVHADAATEVAQVAGHPRLRSPRPPPSKRRPCPHPTGFSDGHGGRARCAARGSPPSWAGRRVGYRGPSRWAVL